MEGLCLYLLIPHGFYEFVQLLLCLHKFVASASCRVQSRTIGYVKKYLYDPFLHLLLTSFIWLPQLQYWKRQRAIPPSLSTPDFTDFFWMFCCRICVCTCTNPAPHLCPLHEEALLAAAPTVMDHRSNTRRNYNCIHGKLSRLAFQLELLHS